MSAATAGAAFALGADLPGCAVVSQATGDQPLGTASRIRSWLLVEHADAWTADVRERALLDRLPRGYSEWLDELWERQGLRPLLIRRVGDRSRNPTERTVLVGGVTPDGGWMERLPIGDLTEVAGIDLGRITSGVGGLGEPVIDPVWLVCTHGGKDLCCAVHGRPLAAALDTVHTQVWECTHVGGDRFAGNLLVLPLGLMYGHLAPDAGVAVAAAISRGELPTEGLRGRTAVSAPQQVAEVAVRDHLGVTRLDGAHVGPATMVADATWRVRVRTGRRIHTVTVRQRPPARECLARCGTVAPQSWEVLALDVAHPGRRAD